VGNSSSGIIEVPSFGIPTLNIGDRQKGRIAANSVVHCDTTTKDIKLGVELVLSKEMQLSAKNTVNPYQKEDTVVNILEVIKNYPLQDIIQKSFYDL